MNADILVLLGTPIPSIPKLVTAKYQSIKRLRKEHYQLTTIYTKHGADFIYKWQPTEGWKLQPCSPTVSISYNGRKFHTINMQLPMIKII
jgi:hypothetical protein